MTTPHPEKRRVVYACIALRVVEAIGIALSATPLLQLIESNVCRKYYWHHNDGAQMGPDGSTSDKLCKAAGVQSDISYINGTNSILTLVPALLASFLYFGITKYVDKRIILLANTGGNLLTHLFLMTIVHYYHIFDIRWMWLSGIFSFVGGGDLIFSAMLQAIIAETVPNSSLSAFYLYSTAGALVAIVIASAGSLSIMETSIWLPVIMGAGTKALNVLIVLLCVDRAEGPQSTTAGFHLLPSEEDDLEPDVDVGIPTPTSHSGSWWRPSPELTSTLKNVAFPLAICILQESANSFRGILPYWLSREYEWSLRDVGFVNIVEKLLTALLMALLPRIPDWILSGAQHRRSEKVSPNLSLSRLCLGFACLGTALLGFRSSRVSAVLSLCVLAVGSGFRDAYLSYINGKIQKDEIVKVCMAFSMVGYMAINIGVFITDGVYSLCLRFGQPWMTSLPIWLCSIVYAWSLFLLRNSE